MSGSLLGCVADRCSWGNLRGRKMMDRFKIKVFKCSACGRVVLHDCAASRVAVCLCGVSFCLVSVRGGRSAYDVEVQVLPSRGRGCGRAPDSPLLSDKGQVKDGLPREGSVVRCVGGAASPSLPVTGQKRVRVKGNGRSPVKGGFWGTWRGSRNDA